MSAAVEVLTNTGLWSKFQDSKTLSLAEAVEATGADEIIISMLLNVGVLPIMEHSYKYSNHY